MTIRPIVYKWAVHSEDDGIVVADTKPAAERMRARWIKRGACNVSPVYGPFAIFLDEFLQPDETEIKLFQQRLKAARPVKKRT